MTKPIPRPFRSNADDAKSGLATWSKHNAKGGVEPPQSKVRAASADFLLRRSYAPNPAIFCPIVAIPYSMCGVPVWQVISFQHVQIGNSRANAVL